MKENGLRTRAEIIATINHASKEKLSMAEAFVSTTTKSKGLDNVLLQMSTVENHTQDGLFEDLDTRFAEEPYPTSGGMDWGGNDNKNIVTEEEQRRLCLALAKEPEVDDILDRYVDEIISYPDNSTYFASPNFSGLDSMDMKKSEIESLKSKMQECFDEVYAMHHFNNRTSTESVASIESIIKTWLSIGKYAWYMVFDDLDNPTEIIAIKQLDLRNGDIRRYEKISRDGSKIVYWVYTPFKSYLDKLAKLNHRNINVSEIGLNERRVVLDAQILYIDWADTDRTNEPYSMVASLERSFNIMRTMERTRISWAIMNSIFRTIYTIPVRGKGAVKAAQTIEQTMTKYRQKVEFDDSSGTFSVNNKITPRLNWEMWVGDTSSGTPQVDTVGGDGPDLSDMTGLEYFRRRFREDSKMPQQRFSEDNPTYFNSSPEQISNEERQWGKRIDRVQRVFSKVIEVPWYRQFILKYPEYLGDETIKNSMKVRFESYNIYAKMLEMELLEKCVSVIEGLRNALVTELPDGNSQPYFALEWLIKRYLPIQHRELEINAEMIEAEKDKREALLADLRKRNLLDEEEDDDGMGGRY